jgi:TonB family protein
MTARSIGSLLFGCFALIDLCGAAGTEPDGRLLAIYAPKPEYPVLPNGHLPQGSGMFLLQIDPKTGVVKSVSVEKSTGSAVLDKTTIDCLRRWKFIRNAGVSKVKIPFTYTATGTFY